jgi:hypothetical protein
MRVLQTDPPHASVSADLAPLIGLRDLDALASMIITALTFPPLPLMVFRGADAADAMASSCDLLKQAIILQRVTGTHRSQEQIVQDKLRGCARCRRRCTATAARVRTRTATSGSKMPNLSTANTFACTSSKTTRRVLATCASIPCPTSPRPMSSCSRLRRTHTPV